MTGYLEINLTTFILFRKSFSIQIGDKNQSQQKQAEKQSGKITILPAAGKERILTKRTPLSFFR